MIAARARAVQRFTNGLTQVILRRHHEKPGMLRLGIALIPAGLAVFALSPHIGGLVAALVGGMIGGVGGGIVQPNTMATIQAITPDHARGGVTSAYLSVSYLAMSIPVVLAGLAASVVGLDLATVASWYLAATAAIATAAIVASLATAPRPAPAKDVDEIPEYAPGSTELVARNPKPTNH